MTKVATIRLASQDDPGAALHNAYIFLTQMAGLYARAGEFEHVPAMSKIWGELCDHLMVDIGDVYAQWEQVLGATPAALADDSRLYARVTRLCQRSETLVERLEVWTPRHKWLGIMALLESRWVTVGTAITRHIDPTGNAMKPLADRSRERRSTILKLSEATKERVEKMQSTYDHFAVKKGA